MKIIEGWGSGVLGMIEECREYCLKDLELIDMEGAFRVNMYWNSPIGQDMANQTLKTNQTTNQTDIDSDKRLAISDLTEPEKQIIEIIKSSQIVNIKRFQSSLIGQLQKSNII